MDEPRQNEEPRESNGMSDDTAAVSSDGLTPWPPKKWHYESEEEMLGNYPYFRSFHRDKMREQGIEVPAMPPDESREEKLANYPFYREFIYTALREEALKNLPDWPPDVNLEEIIKQEGGVPSEVFLAELRREWFEGDE